MKRRLWGVGLVTAVILLFNACSSPSIVPTPTSPTISVTPQTIHLAYPDAVEPLARAWVSAYQREAETVTVVALERADSLAWQALERDEVDVAVLSILPADVPTETWRSPVARDGLAVVVNPQNGLPGMTLDQLRDLFQGRVSSWESWEGLPGTPILISREDASGDARFFQQQVMEGLPVALTAIVAPNTEAVLQFVNERPLSVGYLSAARVDVRARALAIEGVPPSQEMLATGAYPLVRDFELVTTDAPQGAVRDFVQWVLGPKGQSITAAQSWIPRTE